MPEDWRGATCFQGCGIIPVTVPQLLGCRRVAQCCHLCTAMVWEVLCSGRGGFSSAEEGGEEAKGKEGQRADRPGQLSCGAASQALLAELSIPFEWQEQIPALAMAWVSGGSRQQRLLSPARAVLGSHSPVMWPPQLFPCFVSTHSCQGQGCSFCYHLALSKQRGSPECPSGC